jgi:hypothetical protein
VKSALGASCLAVVLGSACAVGGGVIVGPGAPARLVIITEPGGTWYGSILDVQPVVEVRDRDGNLLTRPGLTVTASLTSAGAGVLGGGVMAPVVQGVARFTSLSISGGSAPARIVFRSDSLADVTSAPVVLRQFPADAPFTITISGPEETVLAVDQFGLRHTPDGPISFLRDSSGLRVWFACSTSTCLLQGPTEEQLAPPPGGGASGPVVFGPSDIAEAFDRDYAGGYSTLRSAKGGDLVMIYHAERHPCNGPFPFNMSMGVARSSDGGLTWARQGQIARSAESEPAAGACSYGAFGLGNPSVVVSRDGSFLLMYFNELVTGQPDEIYLARAPIESDGAPGAWLRYSAGSFSSPLLGGTGDPVIHRPDPGDSTIYAGIGSVSWNAFLGRYVAVFGAMDGFYYSTSGDGITWTAGRTLQSGPSPNADIPDGTPWTAYPSLLSFDQWSQLTTSRTGYLYFARGAKGGTPPHYMVRRLFTVTPE